MGHRLQTESCVLTFHRRTINQNESSVQAHDKSSTCAQQTTMLSKMLDDSHILRCQDVSMGFPQNLDSPLCCRSQRDTGVLEFNSSAYKGSMALKGHNE